MTWTTGAGRVVVVEFGCRDERSTSYLAHEVIIMEWLLRAQL
jgi:hypothetical protein